MRGLALAGALLALVALGACKREPSFDERYAGAEKTIRQKAGELDRDMTRRAADAKGAPSEVATDDSSAVPAGTT